MKKSLFQKVERTLLRAFTELGPGFPWDKYGEGIKLTDETGRNKYQGFLLVHVPVGTEFACTRMFGELPDPEKSFVTVRAKLNALEARPDAWASIELRDPPRVWGGAVRNRDRDSWGMTGLPEVADHLVMVYTLYYCRVITRGRRDLFLGSKYPGITSAQAYAGMSDENYKRLVWLIDDIIQAAAT